MATIIIHNDIEYNTAKYKNQSVKIGGSERNKKRQRIIKDMEAEFNKIVANCNRIDFGKKRSESQRTERKSKRVKV